MSIYCEQLKVSLAGKVIIPGLSFQQTKPALIGLLGGNGAGKSTFLRSLAGLQTPDSGVIRINDQTINQTQTLAKTLAYLPQHRTVYWSLTVYEVVMLGRMPYQRAFYPPQPDDHEQVEQVMQQLDVSQFAQRRFHQLSGGEQARVLLARALAQQPAVLLADEPASGLDPAHQIAMMRTFQRIVADGCIILVALHDLNLAARYCDQVVLLQEGRIFKEGTSQAVMTAENLKALFGVDTEVMTLGERPTICVTG